MSKGIGVSAHLIEIGKIFRKRSLMKIDIDDGGCLVPHYIVSQQRPLPTDLQFYC